MTAAYRQYLVLDVPADQAFRYFCFKLVGKCQLLLIFLPNINSHLGVKDSDLGIKHPYTFFPLNMSSFAKTVEVLINSKHEQLP
jgi:hypothetical protein